MTVPTAPNRVTSTPSLLWQPTPRHQTLGRQAVGGLFLVTGGVHLGTLLLVGGRAAVWGWFGVLVVLARQDLLNERRFR